MPQQNTVDAISQSLATLQQEILVGFT